MAKFQIETDDGKKYEIETEDAPAPALSRAMQGFQSQLSPGKVLGAAAAGAAPVASTLAGMAAINNHLQAPSKEQQADERKMISTAHDKFVKSWKAHDPLGAVQALQDAMFSMGQTNALDQVENQIHSGDIAGAAGTALGAVAPVLLAHGVAKSVAGLAELVGNSPFLKTVLGAKAPGVSKVLKAVNAANKAVPSTGSSEEGTHAKPNYDFEGEARALATQDARVKALKRQGLDLGVKATQQPTSRGPASQAESKPLPEGVNPPTPQVSPEEMQQRINPTRESQGFGPTAPRPNGTAKPTVATPAQPIPQHPNANNVDPASPLNPGVVAPQFGDDGFPLPGPQEMQAKLSALPETGGAPPPRPEPGTRPSMSQYGAPPPKPPAPTNARSLPEGVIQRPTPSTSLPQAPQPIASTPVASEPTPTTESFATRPLEPGETGASRALKTNRTIWTRAMARKLAAAGVDDISKLSPAELDAHAAEDDLTPFSERSQETKDQLVKELAAKNAKKTPKAVETKPAPKASQPVTTSVVAPKVNKPSSTPAVAKAKVTPATAVPSGDGWSGTLPAATRISGIRPGEDVSYVGSKKMFNETYHTVLDTQGNEYDLTKDELKQLKGK